MMEHSTEIQKNTYNDFNDFLQMIYECLGVIFHRSKFVGNQSFGPLEAFQLFHQIFHCCHKCFQYAKVYSENFLRLKNEKKIIKNFKKTAQLDPYLLRMPHYDILKSFS